MSAAFGGAEQLKDWLALNDAIDEIAGGQTPCRNAPDVWFPNQPGINRNQLVTSEPKNAISAKNLCRTRCEVMLQCREYALKHEEMDGVWGGMNYADRKQYWREMRDAKKAS